MSNTLTDIGTLSLSPEMCFVKKVLNHFDLLMQIRYSRVSNNRGASNKCMVAYKFFTLLHKIARFGPFLANFSLKINNGGATIIRYSRVSELIGGVSLLAV